MSACVAAWIDINVRIARPTDKLGEVLDFYNPWLREKGALAFADPDNWRIVLTPNLIHLAACVR